MQRSPSADSVPFDVPARHGKAFFRLGGDVGGGPVESENAGGAPDQSRSSTPIATPSITGAGWSSAARTARASWISENGFSRYADPSSRVPFRVVAWFE
jgi:hypothetical protein